jgi:hypothetical protein
MLCRDVTQAIITTSSREINNNNSNQKNSGNINNVDINGKYVSENTKTEKPYKRLPEFMAAVAGSQGGRFVVLASTEVHSNDWLEKRDSLTSDLMGKNSDTKNDKNINKAVDLVLKNFDDIM